MIESSRSDPPIAPADSYRLGVDLGTTFTAAAVAGDMPTAMVGLGNRSLQIPSVLFLADDGEFLVGEVAERRGVAEPDRVIREFKRRIGDHVPLLVAGAPYSPQALTARLLRWVVDKTTERMGRPPGTVVLTHPANWGPYKLDLLHQVGVLADLDRVLTCPEPQAAAAQYAARNRVDPGQRLAVYDLGGGTFDVCVLEQTQEGFRLLGSPEGIEQLGGVDFDEALFQQVLASLGGQAFDLDPEDAAVTVGLARLRRDCVEAKEALSSDVDEVVPVTLPGMTTTVRVTRSEFESLIRPALRDTIAATRRALRSADVAAEDLAAIVLVGGSSRIPLVGEMLQREFGVPTALDTHPKHDVAMGALQIGAVPMETKSQQAKESTPPTTPVVEPDTVDVPEPVEPELIIEPEPDADPESTLDTGSPDQAEPVDDTESTREPEEVDEPEPAGEPEPTSEEGPTREEEPTDQPSERIRRPIPVRALIITAAVVAVAAIVVVVIAVVPGLLRRENPNLISALPSGPSGATSGPSVSSTPSPTPGRQLPGSRPLADTEMIISMEVDGQPALFLADSTKSEPVKQLTDSAGGSSSVVISPDRRSFLYLSADEPEAARDYWIASATKGDADRVPLGERPAQCDGQFFRGAWNPVDPTMIAVPCTDAAGTFGLYLMGIDGSIRGSIPIGEGNRADDPTFSPNGQTLVFWRGKADRSDGALFAASVQGDSSIKRLTSKGSRDADPVFSPDGSTIAFRRRVDNNSDIYSMAADGSGRPQPVITTGADDQDPSWSPDGSQLIYKGSAVSDYPGEQVPRIWVADADGSNQHLLWTDGAPGGQNASAWTRR